MTVLYWHWLVLGMVLVLAEIFIPSFTIFWVGLAALVVGFLTWLGLVSDLTYQILIWTIFSVVFMVAWFKWIKPLSKDRTLAGLSREAVLGKVATVIDAPAKGKSRGTLRFSTPVLGADEWPFFCGEAVKVGEQVIVKDIEGNAMVVSPQTSPIQKEEKER